MDERSVQVALLAWYDANKRDLPWRRTTEPYSVMVSEFMCQQTRVDVAVPYFERWMTRWPTVEALAGAAEEDVMAAWSGLGYYRRARNLHLAAKHVAESGWPDDLTKLPGVGPYMAGAIGSIAFGRPVAAVDGNVERVMARWFRICDNVRKAVGSKQIRAAAQGMVAENRPGDWAQAVMELGATHCAPKPACAHCPVQSWCPSTDDAVRFPVKGAKVPPVPESMHFAAIEQAGKLLMVRRPPGLLAGTWALPGGPADQDLAALVEQQTGVRMDPPVPVGEALHVFSHRKWTMTISRAGVQDIDHRQPPLAVRWVASEDLASLALSTAMRKALAVVAWPQPH